MLEGITLITPTGGRPEAFKRCYQYVNRFIMPADAKVQWLVVNDVDNTKHRGSITDIKFNREVTEISPEHQWKPGSVTLGMNLRAAIPYVKYDKIFIIEDDDWYSERYIIDLLKYFDEADLIGEASAKYYNLSLQKFRNMENLNHASLCQTAFKSKLLKTFEATCLIENMIDVRFWVHARAQKKLVPTSNCIGIKGLSGRPGIGMGHNQSCYGNSRVDVNFEVLRSWIGSDTVLYVPELENHRWRSL